MFWNGGKGENRLTSSGWADRGFSLGACVVSPRTGLRPKWAGSPAAVLPVHLYSAGEPKSVTRNVQGDSGGARTCPLLGSGKREWTMSVLAPCRM
jgi:hypothetical protein